MTEETLENGEEEWNGEERRSQSVNVDKLVDSAVIRNRVNRNRWRALFGLLLLAFGYLTYSSADAQHRLDQQTKFFCAIQALIEASPGIPQAYLNELNSVHLNCPTVHIHPPPPGSKNPTPSTTLQTGPNQALVPKGKGAVIQVMPTGVASVLHTSSK